MSSRAASPSSSMHYSSAPSSTPTTPPAQASSIRPKFAIASLSLGSCLYHQLPQKIQVCAELGYEGIEMFIPDFQAFVEEVTKGQHAEIFEQQLGLSSVPSKDDPLLENICAKALAALCRSHNLEIPILQPYRDFENFKTPEELKTKLGEAERWFKIMGDMETDLLLVCSNFVEGNPLKDRGITLEQYQEEQRVAFSQLGDLAAKYNVRVGYEPLAWGTVINRWDQVWPIVEKVNHPNVGIILDSFNSLGQQYADPSEPDFKRPIPISDLYANLDLLATTIPQSKLFFYQLADAHPPPEQLFDAPNAPARMLWSRASRLFPCESERGAYLPVEYYTQCVRRTGYDGWWSLEVFNKSLHVDEENVVQDHGERGLNGLKNLWAACTK